MKTIVLYTVMQDYITSTYTEIETPSEHVFDESFIKMTAVLADYGDDKQDVMACLCAKGLLSWTEQDREAFLDEYEIPSRVMRQLSNPSEWPEF